ncbi:MAG: quinolinate synthase NadA [Candidatus Heimdallarchaeota archaeon]|nr:quinolinate synthase NadA [Candidatus Heimdallarchaeota archaeon]MDH5647957.1 quinolinate synthase NadA [Candidatus Heimdallarchaeota archaeon]
MQSSTTFTEIEIKEEINRLFNKLKKVNWSKDDCALIAEKTLLINRLKKEKNAVILAHSYQTADVIFGISDFVGDSLGLSKQAADTTADIIIFAGVKFMAETAKVLSPQKTVIVPSIEAGCSLADSITADDVLQMKKIHPGVPVVSYVNTNADIKAVTDYCVTSANVIEVVKTIPEDRIIFLPDKNMADFVRKETGKIVIDWDGYCIVHQEFNAESIIHLKKEQNEIIVIAHSECPPDVLEQVDMVGGTSDMQRFIRDHPEQKKYFLVTECGLSDKLAVEFPDREFYGTCILCPYMKKNNLDNIIDALISPHPSQIINLNQNIIDTSKAVLLKMISN